MKRDDGVGVRKDRRSGRMQNNKRKCSKCSRFPDNEAVSSSQQDNNRPSFLSHITAYNLHFFSVAMTLFEEVQCEKSKSGLSYSQKRVIRTSVI